MSIVFDYVRSKTGGYYPFVPVKLKYRLRETSAEALVDSGATISIFDLSIAHELGIKLNDSQKVALEGIGGSIYGYNKKIWIDVGSFHLKVPVIFTDQFTSVNLLGRNGIFDALNICFSDKNRTIRFSDTKETSSEEPSSAWKWLAGIFLSRNQ